MKNLLVQDKVQFQTVDQLVSEVTLQTCFRIRKKF